ncbi:hypothetical protein C8Q78DRAFT_505817 [Trametes maxima]|nr:hypothetical protein C8Q78DRAFT_505817 [Trametes maxima]
MCCRGAPATCSPFRRAVRGRADPLGTRYLTQGPSAEPLWTGWQTVHALEARGPSFRLVFGLGPHLDSRSPEAVPESPQGVRPADGPCVRLRTEGRGPSTPLLSAYGGSRVTHGCGLLSGPRTAEGPNIDHSLEARDCRSLGPACYCARSRVGSPMTRTREHRAKGRGFAATRVRPAASVGRRVGGSRRGARRCGSGKLCVLFCVNQRVLVYKRRKRASDGSRDNATESVSKGGEPRH